MILRVVAPHFVAGAVWEINSKGIWECVAAAPVISWMIGKPGQDTKRYIAKKKWDCQWI